jgi:choline dehydrogenase
MTHEFSEEAADFVIIGAGSAGCVLADRLSADGKSKVVIIEAGGDDRPLKNLSQFMSNVMIYIPAGYVGTMTDPKVNWNFKTEPDVSNRVFPVPRGKVLGGSSSINGILYVRGQPEDYDGWRQLGCEGWSWQDVLPYFKRSENNERGADECHGGNGPLQVTDLRARTEIGFAVIDACEQAGIPRSTDYNGHVQEGATWYQQTSKDGVRCSTAVAFLHPAMKRDNLTVLTNSLATKILMDGKRAVGVAYTRGGVAHQVQARREVILSGGAINSPQLLQLSGLGAADLLKTHGIDVVANIPGVGENLQDHFGGMTSFRLKPHVKSINELTHGWKFAGELLRYAIKREGLLTFSAGAVAVFCKSRPELASADIQYHVLSASFDMRPSLKPHLMRRTLEREPGLTFASCLTRPESRGYVRVASPDPTVAPAIAPNYLSAKFDQDVTVKALRLARKIASQPALQSSISHEIRPGPSFESDSELLEYARSTGNTYYHHVGTCRMGTDDVAVVDPQLRVKGIAGLRVVDASIMPRIASGNTNATTVMIAEKASDMILGRRPLEARPTS